MILSIRKTSRYGLCLTTAAWFAMLPSHGAEPAQAPEVKEALAAIRNTHAAVYDALESSTLGKTATPAEFAATQRDWRAIYSQPPVQLSKADRDTLAAKVGKVSLFGRPRAVSAFPLGILGAEVIDVDTRPELTVTAVTPDTPAAAGGMKVDDVIAGVNGRVFPEWEDPRLPLGYAIAAAQTKAFNGKLILHVGRDGKVIDLTITLPISVPYDENHPYAGERARQVAADAVAHVMKEGDDTFWMDLFLLACGDEQAIALVRDRLRKASTAETVGSNWASGYTLISLCEYHLLTGDQEVLPAIRGHVRGIEKNQMRSGGWSHGPPGGYGIINNVGLSSFIGLILAEECGVKTDPKVMAKAIRYFGRFIGSGGAYGDHPPGVGRYGTGAPFENGQTCMRAVVFHLLGEQAVATRDGRQASYLYRTRMGGHAERIFAIAWSSLGAARASEEEYKTYANNMLWFYELSRQRNGSLKNLAWNRYGRNTAAVGMTFAMADKRLRIAGAAKGTKPLFPVASLPAAPTPPPLQAAPKPKIETPAPKEMKWDATAVTLPPVKAATEMTLGVFTLQHDPKAYELCRVTVPGQTGGELWLNGSCVAIFPKVARHQQEFQTLELGRKAISLLKKGENRLALKGAVLDKPTTLETAFAPAQAGGTQPVLHKAEYGNNARNGWSGTWEQHRQGVAWFFEGKSPKEIARYLAYPDWMGAQTAYQTLAAGGDEAVRLAKQLVNDSHSGIRIGAWDAIAEMNTRKLLDTATQQELAHIAASRINSEDPSVGMALTRAATPMAEGEELSKLLVGAARLEDPLARGAAAGTAMNRLKDQPKLMIPVLRIVIAAKLHHGDIAGLGSAMMGVANVATTPEARGVIPEIAAVLDETAPDTRGMFSNGMMSNGLDVIDIHLDDEVEKTPQLVSGLSRCLAKVPDMDHPAWTFPNIYLRRLIYRLGPVSAAAIDKAVAGMANGGGEPARAEPLAELKAWSATLKKTRGQTAALRTEALRLAASKDPAERLVALSLVWPSHVNIGRAPMDRSAKFTDTARLTDPADRLAVAAAAAKHFESNTGTHWLLIWETAKFFKDRPESQQVLASLPEFFDTVAYRKRGTFMFRAIKTAADLAQSQLAAPGANTHVLVRGLCKTYSTAGSMVWYTAIRDQLQTIVTPLAATSPQAVTEAQTAMQTWLKEAPKEEKDLVFAYGYRASPAEVGQRLSALIKK